MFALCFAVVTTCEVRFKVKKTNAYHSDSSATRKQFATIRLHNMLTLGKGMKVLMHQNNQMPLCRGMPLGRYIGSGSPSSYIALNFHSALLLGQCPVY